MQRSFAFLLFIIVLCSSAFSEERGTVQCEPGFTGSIPAWTEPGRPYVLEQLNCGQLVSVVGLEGGYVKIQIGDRVAYVESRNVKLPQAFGQAAARSPEPSKPKPARYRRSDRELLPRHSAGAGFEISNIYYDEPDLMRNKGWMYGVSGDYAYRPNRFMFKIDGRFSLGSVDYWSARTGIGEGLRDYNFETRFSVGYDIKSKAHKSVFTPFIGLGYRYLFDGESGARSSNGYADYDRKQHYLYSPMGMETLFSIADSWKLGLTGEYDLFWHGVNHSEINEIGSPAPIKLDQRNGWGTRGSVKIIKSLWKSDYSIEPYFRYWSIDRSDVAFVVNPILISGSTIYIGIPGVEPQNTTTEWGLRLGVRF